MKPIRELSEDEVLEYINDKTQELIQHKDMPVSIARLYANLEYLHTGDLEEFELHANQIAELNNYVQGLTNTVMELFEFKRQQTINL